MYFLLIGLFVALTPGILVTLPNKGSKVAVAATHALLFAVVVYLLRKYQYEGFQDKAMPMPATPPMPTMPATPPMPPGSKGSTAPGSGPGSITLTKEDLQQLKNSMLMQKLMGAMQSMGDMQSMAKM